MELLIAIIITGVILSFYIISFKKDKDKNLFGNIATLIQTLAAVWAIWYAVNESTGNNEQFKTNLSKQDTLIGLQKSLIGKQDKTAELNLQALKTLADTSGKLVENVEKVNELVSEMPGKIDGVSASFATLTEYAKQETEILRSNSLKKADIFIDNILIEKMNDYTFGFLRVTLINTGNIEGKVSKIIFYFDKNLYNAVGWELQYDQCIINNKEKEFEFEIDLSDYNLFVFAFDSKTITTCNGVKFTRKFIESNSLSFKFQVIFADKNEGRYNEGIYTINF
ncbi:MAG TPA: hypothetical protein PKE39_09435 [Ignavibacteria bacterium]|nr:hypothetical protein [Ignavibacteria bacterium]HMQ99233.1 hypothetical protein [Ignavibacteria bacterium]